MSKAKTIESIEREYRGVERHPVPDAAGEYIGYTEHRTCPINRTFGEAIAVLIRQHAQLVAEARAPYERAEPGKVWRNTHPIEYAASGLGAFFKFLRRAGAIVDRGELLAVGLDGRRYADGEYMRAKREFLACPRGRLDVKRRLIWLAEERVDYGFPDASLVAWMSEYENGPTWQELSAV